MASEHGTRRGYEYEGCRCQVCRSWNATKSHVYRQWRAAQRTDGVNTSLDCPHGTVNGYQNYRCRCDRCRAAQRQARQKPRAGRSPGQN